MKKKSVTRRIYSKYSFNDIEKRIDLLGIDKTFSALQFLNFRLFSSIFLLAMILYLVEWGYIVGPIVVIMYYYFLPRIVIDRRVNIRKSRLENEAMYFFEVLCLSIESGNNIYNALLITSKSIDTSLSREFRQVIEDVELGKSFEDALDDLKKRIPGDTINNIILNIKESSMFGNNITDTLYNQIDYLREKKLLETRAYIAKIPLKISIISVLFFIPLLLLLILGPLLINYLS